MGEVMLAHVGTGFDPFPYGVALAVGIAALLVVPLLRLPTILVAWGALLPIWSVGSIDPAMFDAARLVGAVVIVGMVGKGRPSGEWVAWVRGRWIAPLVVAAALVLAFGTLKADSLSQTTGSTMLLALAVSWAVVRSTPTVRPILIGYLVGITLSAVMLILTALGFDALAPQSNPGLDRYTGLAPSATLVSYQLALGIVLAWTMRSRQRAAVRLLAVTILCTAALFLSGGRGGLVAVAAAALILARWGRLRVPSLIALGLLGWLGVLYAESQGILVNTLHRFDPSTVQPGADLTSGRLDLLDEAFRAIVSAPIDGTSLTTFLIIYGATPHAAVMTFAVAGGVAAGAIIAWLGIKMVATVLAERPRGGSLTSHVLIGVFLVWMMVEPVGPFVGLEGLTMLLISLRQMSEARQQQALPVDQLSTEA